MNVADEALHMTGTQHMLNLFHEAKDDPLMWSISHECKEEAIEIFRSAAEQEKQWAGYLFKDGSMVGLNEDILCQYVEFITNQRMSAIGFEPIFETRSNPLPWMNNWLSSDNIQPSPQETEITSYLVGQIDSTIDDDMFDGFEL